MLPPRSRLRPALRRRRVTGRGHDLTDVEFVIAQTGEWIRAADTKAGLLFGAVALLGGWAFASARAELALVRAGVAEPLGLLAIGLSALVITVAGGLLLAVLMPRVGISVTRYAWPWVAAVQLPDVMSLGTETRRQEAWIQAMALARIAGTKHRLLRGASWCSALGGATLLMWSLLRP